MAAEAKSKAAGGSPTTIGEPTIARVWDTLLGGKDNFAGDRDLVKRARAIHPEVADLAWAIHDFRKRAVAQLAGPGRIDQFIECGPGLPTSDQNTHEVAQRFNPEARVLYVDRDRHVVSHARALLATNELVRVIDADPLDAAAIRKHPDLEDFIDWDRPIAVVNTVLLPFAAGQDRGPRAFLTQYIPELVSGSHLVLAFFAIPQDEPPAQLGELSDLFTIWLRGGQFLAVPEIAAMLEGMAVPEPGVTFCDLWWPDDSVDEPARDSIRRCAVGVVAQQQAHP